MNFTQLLAFTSIIAIFELQGKAAIENFKSPSKLTPSKSISGMFDPFKEALTCDILTGQNMVYTSGQVEDLCRVAYRNCIVQGLLKEKIAGTKSNSDLPVGVTLSDLQSDLTYSTRLVNFYLRGCQLAIRATEEGTQQINAQTLEEAAGY